MKCRTLLCLLLLASLLVSKPVIAQQNDWKEAVKRNIELEEDIKKAVSDTLTLSQLKIGFQSLISGLDERISSIERQIADIQYQTDSRTRQALSSDIDSLKSVVVRLDSTRKALAKQLAGQKGILSQLKRELSEMDVYSKIQRDGLFDEYRLIFPRRYSEISDEKLAEISDNLEEFSYRKDYDEFKGRVAFTVRNRSLYKASSDALDSEYDEEVIADLRRQLSEILLIDSDDVPSGMFKLSDEQYWELDSLDIKLNRYKNGLNELKNIVTKVNSNVDVINYRKAADRDACLAVMSSIVQPNDENARIYERYFELIPYLKRTIEAYWKELQADPLASPGEVEKKIEQM